MRLPAWCVPRRAYGIEIIATALAAHLAGFGRQTTAAELGVPAGTARDWLRQVRARAEALRAEATRRCHALDPLAPPIDPAGSPAADALAALAAAVAAARRRFGYPETMGWSLLGQAGLASHLTPTRGG